MLLHRILLEGLPRNPIDFRLFSHELLLLNFEEIIKLSKASHLLELKG